MSNSYKVQLNKGLNYIKVKISGLSVKDWLLIIAGLLLIVFYSMFSYYYNKSKYPTVIYQTDSLEVYKNKYNDEYVAKEAYVQKVNQLKEQNQELYDEIKSLNDNPLVVTKTNLVMRVDTVQMVSDNIQALSDSVYQLDWSYTNQQYFGIKGHTNVINNFSKFTTYVDSMSMQTKLTLNIVDDKENDAFKIAIKSDNPYLSITGINGSVVDPTKSSVIKQYFPTKRWGIGPYLGVGIGTDWKVRPQIGIGVTYSIFRF